MFLIMAITNGRKDLPFHQMIVCSRCGQYGSYSVYMTYTVLSLFFIPCFKWNRRYYVTTSCCKATYELSSEIGRRIARGEAVEIRPEDLTYVASSSGYGSFNVDYNSWTKTRDDDHQGKLETYHKDDSRSQDKSNPSLDMSASAYHKDNSTGQESNKEDDDDWYISGGSPTKICSNCGFSTQEDYDFCPKCGKRL